MTQSHPQKTKIGWTVNQFRKAVKDDEVVNLAKSIIKGWKKFLAPDNNQSQKNNGGSSSLNSSTVDEESKDSTTAGDTPQASSSPSESTDLKGPTPMHIRRHSSTTEVDDTSDPVRLKCRELLTKALQTPRELNFFFIHLLCDIVNISNFS